MTESELLESSALFWSNSISILAILTTIISGYLITAYVAGKDFDRIQVTIINTLYIAICTLLLFAILNTGQIAAEMESIAFAMTTQRTHPPQSFFAYVALGFWLFCILLSIKFMWDIRHRTKS